MALRREMRWPRRLIAVFFPCYAKIEIACGGSTGMQVWDLDSNVDMTGIWWRGSGHHFQNNISKMNPESVLI